MMKILYKISKVLLSAGFLFIYSCGEDPAPSLFELADESSVPPVISSLNPPDKALAGITPITITGEHFSEIPQNNIVTFNGIKGKVISSLATQLTVVPPVVVSDSVAVKIAVTGSVVNPEFFSNVVIYKLAPAVAEAKVGGFDAKQGEIPYAITSDGNDSIYVSIFNKGVKKISGKNLTDYVPFKTGETFFFALTYGPNDVIYGARKLKGILQMVQGSPSSTFVSSANGIRESVLDTDFDQNGILWAGSDKDAIYSVTLTKVVKEFKLFTGAVNALKVFENSLFVAATVNAQEIIYKFPINSADTTLGTPEVYFNFSANVSSAIKIKDIAIALDGDIYLGTDRINDPIIVVHPDKNFETLYPGLINNSIYSFVWGNGVFLYATVYDFVNNTGITVIKIDLEKPGAPYYGRQ